MSRFYYDDWDEPYLNAGEMWAANARRALAGKRGRKALAELREALLALPEKRLIAGALCTVGGVDRPDVRERTGWSRQDAEAEIKERGEGVCAIGAYLWHKKVKAGVDPQVAFEELPMLLDSEHSGEDTAVMGRQAGLTFTLAWELARRNDEIYDDMTPESRYEAFIAWIGKQLAPPLESQVS